MEETNLNYKLPRVKSSTFSFDFQSSVKHILIIRPGALGDLIVTLPALKAIRNHFHGAHIEIMGYMPFLEIVKGRFYVDTTSRFDQANISPLFIKDTQIPVSLIKRFSRMDLIISFVLDKEQIFIENLKATGAPCVIHYEPFPQDNVHITDHFLEFLDLLGISHFSEIPKIFLQNEDVLFADHFIKDRSIDQKKLLIAIHPGSGSLQKCWPIERFSDLILWLNKELGAQVLIISGPADNKIIEKLRERVKDNFKLVDQLPLPNLAAVLRRCDLFIGNDSGITHLAAAVGTSTIAIFGATDPNVWGPRGKRVKILYEKVSCSPCISDKRKICFSPICLENITLEDVIREVGYISDFYKYNL